MEKCWAYSFQSRSSDFIWPHLYRQRGVSPPMPLYFIVNVSPSSSFAWHLPLDHFYFLLLFSYQHFIFNFDGVFYLHKTPLSLPLLFRVAWYFLGSQQSLIYAYNVFVLFLNFKVVSHHFLLLHFLCEHRAPYLTHSEGFQVWLSTWWDLKSWLKETSGQVCEELSRWVNKVRRSTLSVGKSILPARIMYSVCKKEKVSWDPASIAFCILTTDAVYLCVSGSCRLYAFSVMTDWILEPK